MEKLDYDRLLSLPLEEYQREIGRLLSAVITIACEEKPGYEEELLRQKKELEEQRMVVVK